jgi:polyisoprenoid-binding protein YceI
METDGFEGFIDADTTGGQLHFDVTPKAHLELEVDRLESGNRMYDHELERRLDVRRYPRVKGDVSDVLPIDGGNRCRVKGDLSLHGVTRSVEGEVTFRVLDDDTIEIEGEKTIDMRSFGLEPPKILVLRVHPEVKIRARLIAKRED